LPTSLPLLSRLTVSAVPATVVRPAASYTWHDTTLLYSSACISTPADTYKARCATPAARRRRPCGRAGRCRLGAHARRHYVPHRHTHARRHTQESAAHSLRVRQSQLERAPLSAQQVYTRSIAGLQCGRKLALVRRRRARAAGATQGLAGTLAGAVSRGERPAFARVAVGRTIWLGRHITAHRRKRMSCAPRGGKALVRFFVASPTRCNNAHLAANAFCAEALATVAHDHWT
jgi:hypothetical protein